MKYRVRMDLIFKETTDAEDIIKFFRSKLLPKLTNFLDTTGEKSWAELEECHHDESPPQPCKVIKRIEKE